MRAIYITAILAMALNYGCGNSNEPESTAGTDMQDSAAMPVANDQAAAAPTATAFSKTVAYKQINFTVTTADSGGNNSFTITPSGYTADNTAYTQDLPSTAQVTDVKTDDIDGDDNPEVMVITQQGTDSTGWAYVYSSNSNKSFSMVNLPEIPAGELEKEGYKGHDAFEFVEGTFIRRFPVYSNNEPTGKYHQVQYKLKPGEAMKQLVQSKAISY